jgi:outer membrane protein assembly factor BamB
MQAIIRRGQFVLAAIGLTGLVQTATAQTSVLTYHDDNARSGANTTETRLTPKNVRTTAFGKQFSQPVDGQIYGQPLLVRGVRIAGKGTHHIVIAVTQANSVFAFDADSGTGSNATPLWKASLIDKAHGAADGARSVNTDDFGLSPQGYGCTDIAPTIGITSTPVVDKARNTLFVVAKSWEGGSAVQRLHALDLGTGQEKPGSPTLIAPAEQDGAQFDPLWNLNRPALLLANDRVYVSFGSHCDGFEVHRYHGWLLSFDAQTYLPTGALPISTGQQGQEGGALWNSGAGPAADTAGHVFVATGDGTYDGANNLGDSLIKLDGLSLAPLDHFTPSDQSQLNAVDADLGSSGMVLLPDQSGAHPHLLAQASKDGRLYFLDRDHLGGYCESCSDGNALQAFPRKTLGSATPPSYPVDWLGLFGVPSFWNQRLYVWAVGDTLKAFDLSNGLLKLTPQSGTLTHGYPGSTLSISSNGKNAGVVWAIEPHLGSAAVLQAFDATSLALLYSSATRAEDAAGPTVKFTTPMVANGRVYVGTGDRLDVYALRIRLFGRWVPLY